MIATRAHQVTMEEPTVRVSSMRSNKEWGIVGSTGQRVRVSENRIRVPDLVVLTNGAQPDVLTDPPLLVIEIRGIAYTPCPKTQAES